MNRSYRPPKNKNLPSVKLRQKRQYDFDDSEEQWDTFESPNVQFGSQNTTNESTICERSKSPGELDFSIDLSKTSLKYENFKPKLDSTHKEDCVSSKAVEETSLTPMIENRSESFLSTKNIHNLGIHGIHSECDSRKQYSQTRNSSIKNPNKSNSKADQDLTLHSASVPSLEKMVAVQSVHQTQMRNSHSEANSAYQIFRSKNQCNSQSQFVQTRNTSTKVTDDNMDKSNSKVSFNVTPEPILKPNSKKATQLVHTRDRMAKLQSENTDSFELHLDSNAVRPVKTPVFSRDVNVSRVKRALFKDSPDLLENFSSRSKSKKRSVPEGRNIKATLTLPANTEVKLNIKRRALHNVNKSEILVNKSTKILKNKEISVTNTLRSSFENAHCNGTSNPEPEILDLREYRSGNGASIDIITLLHEDLIPQSVKYIYYD